MAIDVRFLAGSEIEEHDAGTLPSLLARDDGITWVDIPACDAEAQHALSDVFGFHPLAVRSCVERTRVPKVHAYKDHVFVVLHGPERGRAGHIHYVELDLFVGPNYLVTVHGPVNPAVEPAVALRETRAVLERIEAGRLRPKESFELLYAVISAMARTMEGLVEELTSDAWRLEQLVTSGDIDHSEDFLEDLFQTRHGLLAVRTMAVLNREIFDRVATVARFVPEEGGPFIDDLVEQFDRVLGIANGQKDYVEGVIEHYRTRTETKMTIAAERLAVIAVITLPITALASVYGMNVIVNDDTDLVHLAIVLLVMAAMSATLLRWAKRQGWW
ncbi:MAG TPA: magnesium transporter CorA family protein [Euzebyales bacterium]|nr:magnesium transporter CorA family protein [Euzebyales bacterium]